jgi:cytochrome c oxidase subunit 1
MELREADRFRRVTRAWMAASLVLFVVLSVPGILMRFVQSNLSVGLAPRFYPMMTLHGVGMVGLWFVSGMAGVVHLSCRYVRPSLAASWIAFGATAVGVLLLAAATLIGSFAPGWYFLYPLPFPSFGGWPAWSAGAFFLSLGIMGAAWLVWGIDLLRAIARRYSLGEALAWHYLRGKSTPEVPPLVLITTVSLVVLFASILSAVVTISLFVAEWLTGYANDPLLMKNMGFFFGHLLVNLTMYLGVAMVYELLPHYTGRAWKTSKPVAVAWNTALLLVLVATFHHLYMDFVQPRWSHVVGQIASYASSVPAAVMSIFGTLALVYRSRMRWTLASILLFLGVLGWAIGGVAAVIDSTISVNLFFHNTVWVPAHFHTYFLMGVVLMILGFAYHFVQDHSGRPERPGWMKCIAVLLVVGGYGFLMTFYLGGAAAVPRRFATYPPEVAQGAWYAAVSLPFLVVLSVGVLLYLWEVGRRWRAIPVVLAFLLASTALPGAADEPYPDEARYLDRAVPDVAVECSPGGALRLSQLWDERPLILAPVFANCAGVCSTFLHSLKAATESAGPPGGAYEVVVVSFDPEDTVRDLARFLRELDVAGNPAWRFCTASSDGIGRLTRSIGFRFRRDEATGQFDHPAVLVGIDRGRVARLLPGSPVDPRRLGEVIGELRREFIPFYPLPRKLLVRCLSYDVRTDRFSFDWGALLLFVPGASAVLGTLGIFVLGKRSRME